MLKGDDQLNSKTGEWTGLYGMKYKFLERRIKGYELVLVDVQKWQKMSEQDQYAQLYNVAKVKVG